MTRWITLALCLVLTTACGGGGSDESTTQSTGTTETAQADPAAGASKGIGPITNVALGPIDDAVAVKGKEIFTTKCSACHKWEERYVGPALNGVTQRREPEWILNMILNPDEMIKQDEQAKALFTEYLTPMTFQNVTQEEAEAILTYFRSLDEHASDDDSSDEDSSDESPDEDTSE